MDVMAGYPVIRMSDTMPEESRLYRVPASTPDGRPVLLGPKADMIPEILALVATGRGVFPVGQHAARFYPRPDIAYLPMADAPPVRWAPVGLSGTNSGLIRAFVDCAVRAADMQPTWLDETAD